MIIKFNWRFSTEIKESNNFSIECLSNENIHEQINKFLFQENKNKFYIAEELVLY